MTTPTKEDFEKAREIISNDRIQSIRNGNSPERLMVEEIAQALAEQSEKLESEKARLEDMNRRLVLVMTPNESSKLKTIAELEDKVIGLEKENQHLANISVNTNQKNIDLEARLKAQEAVITEVRKYLERHVYHHLKACCDCGLCNVIRALDKHKESK